MEDSPKTKPKEILVCIGVHLDAVAGWLGKQESSVVIVSQGMFGGEVGSMRLLKLFERENVKTSWFIPGHSIETFPEQVKAVAEAGHEIGLHGYCHEKALRMNPEQEEQVFDKCIDLVKKLCGKPPAGYIAPFWQVSNVTHELLIKKGLKYDSSLMHQDYQPHYVRLGDTWTEVDYQKPAETWMKPLVRGQQTTKLVEIPASWFLDDFPTLSAMTYRFLPSDLEKQWKEAFDWVYREYDYAVFPLCIHPQVSGHPHVLLMLERIFAYFRQFPGVKFCTFEEVADDFLNRCPPK
ncbi:polysaccharide deacetylase domain-containing protein [Ditylenchus destructor]|uniref:Polysaccharide deacetylase domain-containing protein n=1 Tax=Ditylenchus destructor TaxID=166010 RepID=A0AAD4N708_9BILA|nr:polysaccharide deacetylase domain-containing protein [Ditylenchus destructor]